MNLYRKGLGLTFNYDEWNWVMNRRGWSAATLLDPHNEHLSLVPVLIFKLLFVTVGIDAYWPYRVALILVHLVCVALVFVLVRRRLGDVFALVLAALILFLGSAWQDLLWPFQIGYLGSVAAGLGMLLALERRDTTGRVLGCVRPHFVGPSVGSPRRGRTGRGRARRPGPWLSSERWRHVWVVAVPVALYALWFAIYGNPNATPGNAHGFGLVRQNGPVIPSYAADMAANAFAGLAGLAIDWGRPLAVAALVIGIWWSAHRRLSLRTLSLLVGLALLWGLTALLRAQLNGATDNRYIYPSRPAPGRRAVPRSAPDCASRGRRCRLRGVRRGRELRSAEGGRPISKTGRASFDRASGAESRARRRRRRLRRPGARRITAGSTSGGPAARVTGRHARGGSR